jgi:hypothetical protein
MLHTHTHICTRLLTISWKNFLYSTLGPPTSQWASDWVIDVSLIKKTGLHSHNNHGERAQIKG